VRLPIAKGNQLGAGDKRSNQELEVLKAPLTRYPSRIDHIVALSDEEEALLVKVQEWLFVGIAPLVLSSVLLAQTQPPSATPTVTLSQSSQPLQITLNDALQRATIASPAFERAALNVKIAREDRVQTRAALLPTGSATSQYIFTQGDGHGVNRFILNNAVHEYIAEGSAHEVLSATLLAQYRRSIATETLTRDQLAITQRGLVVTVVQSYASVVASNNKYKTLQQVRDAAADFLNTTQELEKGGEVAHADVVKARIQFSDSQVALRDAQLFRERDRVSLALLLFSDVNQNFDLLDEPGQTLPLPTFAEEQAAARQHNPTLNAARDIEKAASLDITTARTGYLPTLTFDYLYGIDATHFATRTGNLPNLGYSASGQLNWQLWNWGATHSQVKAAEYRKQQASFDLAFAERRLTADLQQFFNEATAAKSEMALQKSAAQDAEESLKLTTLRYKAGEATALEVVSAQTTLSVEHNAYEDTQVRYAIAIANLATLTGHL